MRTVGLWGALWVLLGACGGSNVDFTSADWTLVVGESRRTVTLPTALDLPSRDLTYRMEQSVELPRSSHGERLEVHLPYLPARVRLVVDGEPLARQERDQGRYRHVGSRTWYVPERMTRDGVLELSFIVDHRWTQSAWWRVRPELSSAGTHDGWVWSDALGRTSSILALMALAQIGLACLAVFGLDRRRRPYLWFGIQAISASIYPLYVCGWLADVFGRWDTLAVALALIVASTVSVYFTHEFFGRSRPNRGWLASAGVACVISVGFGGPYALTGVGAPATVFVVSTVSLYQVVICVDLVRRHDDRWSAGFLLAAWLSLACTAWVDMQVWLGGPELLAGARPATVGLAFFAVSLTLLLSRSHIVSLNQADALNEELGARVTLLRARRAEIEQLNLELRRQIGDRSSQLVAALALSHTERRAAPTLEPGTLVQGRYRVVGPLGSGGMGCVYEVERESDGRHFAMKLAHDLDGMALARLAREAQIASGVAHVNVVTIHDVDVSSGGFLYLVMELVEGPSLREARERFGDVDWALPILRQIVDGLMALHGHGVVHRDLKPANVLLTGDGEAPRVRITDFGISRIADVPLEALEETGTATVRLPTGPHRAIRIDDDGEARTVTDPSGSGARKRRASSGSNQPQLTQTGHIAGTPLYMAPEVAMGGAILPSADIFSLGVLGYELLTGERPWSESVALATIDGRSVERPPPMHDAVPNELAGLILACLSLAPEERPDLEQLASLLHRLAGRYDSESNALG